MESRQNTSEMFNKGGPCYIPNANTLVNTSNDCIYCGVFTQIKGEEVPDGKLLFLLLITINFHNFKI
jgi:hypothetical protein